MTDNQIEKVKEIYNNWRSADVSLYSDVPELCKSVHLEGEGGIRDKDYSLVPSKYIEFVDHDLEMDYAMEMQRIQTEMCEVMKQEKRSQAMLEEAFKGIGYGIN